MHIVFLIRSLESGGAERQLVELVRHLDPGRFRVTVVTFYPGGRLAKELDAFRHVRVVSADKGGRWDVARFLVRVYKLVRGARPDVVHGYMYGANELALVLARLLRAKAVWGIRCSALELNSYDWTWRWLFRLGARLSRFPDAIIANSVAGKASHVAAGYPPERVSVIPNGIDTDVYVRNEEGRKRVRREWNVGEDVALIGVTGRIDPMKDHRTFLRAASELVGKVPVKFVIVGPGTEERVNALKAFAETLNVADHVIWAGSRQDMPAVYSALDIVTSSSAFGEGFSNALAEAMACETPCVATDVGDARVIMSDIGEVVPVGQPAALAEAWRRVLRLEPAERSDRVRRGRKRILESYDASSLAARTAQLLDELSAPTVGRLGDRSSSCG